MRGMPATMRGSEPPCGCTAENVFAGAHYQCTGKGRFDLKFGFVISISAHVDNDLKFYFNQLQ